MGQTTKKPWKENVIVHLMCRSLSVVLVKIFSQKVQVDSDGSSLKDVSPTKFGWSSIWKFVEVFKKSLRIFQHFVSFKCFNVSTYNKAVQKVSKSIRCN